MLSSATKIHKVYGNIKPKVLVPSQTSTKPKPKPNCGNSEIMEEITKVKQITVAAEYAGQRLDNFLINLLKGLPKTRVYRIIRKGEVRVNKGRIGPDYRIVAGDIVRIPPMRLSQDPINLKKSSSKIPTKVNEQLLSQILYEDEGMIILNKPSGMAVHGGSGLSFGVIEALRILRQDCPNLELVHRLDRETSGCLMIAKRRSILRWLHELLRTGQIEKRYWALVKGEWRAGKEVNQPLQKNQLSSGERMVRVKAGGQEALTAFRVLNRYSGTRTRQGSDEFHESGSSLGTNLAKATLMEACPITGRTHQIRVHAEFAGSPVAGDDKYGDESFNREMKKLGLSRLFLHAISIKIPLSDKNKKEDKKDKKETKESKHSQKAEHGNINQYGNTNQRGYTERNQDYLIIEAPLEKALTQVLFNLSGEAPHG